MALPKIRISPAEYLEFERASEIKHEYFDGEFFAMSGASREHNLIAMNVGSEIRQQLKDKPCEAYPSEMRVFVPATDLYTYPDVTIVCGAPEFQDKEFDTLLNPTLIVEILSPSTESYDRGKKFAHYRSIKSLRQYVLIAQDEPRVETYVRQEKGFWLLSDATGLDAKIELETVGCALELAEIYDRVSFQPSPVNPELLPQ